MQAPRFEVDPLWPKPLPNHWLLGSTIGVCGRRPDDHVWIIHRGAATLGNNEKDARAEPAGRRVLRGRAAGARVRPGRQPARATGAARRRATNGRSRTTASPSTTRATSGSAATARPDAHDPEVHQGRQVPAAGRQEGRAPQTASAGQAARGTSTSFVGGSNDRKLRPRRENLRRSEERTKRTSPTATATTASPCSTPTPARCKRYWGAYGNKPDDTDLGRVQSRPRRPRSSSATRCTAPSCPTTACSTSATASNDRIQVFTPDGKFVKEAFIAEEHAGAGSVWDIAFSKDPQQKYIYLADGANEKVHIIQRDTLEVLTSFGDGGRQPGQFYGVHSIATDSKGTSTRRKPTKASACRSSSTRGWRRSTKEQGVVWPASK